MLDKDTIIIGDKEQYFNNVRPSESIDEFSLDWVNPLKKRKADYIRNSKAKVIICDESAFQVADEIKNKCLIITKNPKLTFVRIVGQYFTNQIKYQVHSTAIIDPDAKISSQCYIGPFTYIGKSRICDGTIVYGHCHIYDNVYIGKNVIIHAGVVIGSDGFGYQRNEYGIFEKFPHIGGVIIEDDVEIGSNTSIDRGTLGNTIIEQGTKIDNLVQIAHNVHIGKHTAIIANTMIGGSTSIGSFSWIAPTVSLRDQLKIGNNVTIGMGAVVTRNIPDDETWAGSPAKPFEEYALMQDKLKRLNRTK